MGSSSMRSNRFVHDYDPYANCIGVDHERAISRLERQIPACGLRLNRIERYEIERNLSWCIERIGTRGRSIMVWVLACSMDVLARRDQPSIIPSLLFQLGVSPTRVRRAACMLETSRRWGRSTPIARRARPYMNRAQSRQAWKITKIARPTRNLKEES